MACDILFFPSVQKLGFGAMFCKRKKTKMKEGVEKNEKKFRVSVKMRYNILKFRNVSLLYVQVSVFR